MTGDLLDTIARLAAVVFVAGVVASGVEEVVVDLVYFARGLHRRRRRAITAEELRRAPQRDVAIMIPAWREAEVIGEMLEHNIGELDYDPARYTVFCGTYPNDAETQRVVESLRQRHHHIHHVVVPVDGPTSKADCLNWIYQAVMREERRRDRRFDILVVHDVADVIHPLSLRLDSLLIPEYDLVQLPVLPLGRRYRSMIGAACVDQLVERELEEMPFRDAIGAVVTSPGIGVAFARGAFDEVARTHGFKPFNPASLAGDGEIALRFRLAGMRNHAACRAVVRTIRGPRLWGSGVRTFVEDEYIATREYIPDRFVSLRERRAPRAGRLGWRGRAAARYGLWRERKAAATNLLLLGAYLVAAYAGARAAIAALGGPPWELSALIEPGSALAWLLVIAAGLVLWRAAMRFYLIKRLDGVAVAAAALPRLIVGHAIDVIAAARALVSVTRTPVVYSAVELERPEVEVFRGRRQRLGELLVARRQLSADDVDQTLQIQEGTSLRFGEVLAASGLLTPRAIARAVSEQLELPSVDLAPYDVPVELLRALPEQVAAAFDAVPASVDYDGRPRVAMVCPPRGDQLQHLTHYLGAAPVIALASPESIRRTRWRAYRRLLDGGGEPGVRLGDRMIALGLMGVGTLGAALEEQMSTGEHLGELVLRWQLVDPEQLSAALPEDLPPYVSVNAWSVDTHALRALGYGLSSLYLLAPLRDPATGHVTVASPFPLHPDVLAEIRRRLDGVRVAQALAPGLQVRVALAIASSLAWPHGLARGRADLDGSELAAVGAEPELAGRVNDVARLSQLLELSPIDALEASSRIAADRVAGLRARALGLPVVDGSRGVCADDLVVPPELSARHHIRVIGLGPRSLTLAAPRPTPRLAHQIAELFPAHAVAWCVHAVRSSRHEEVDREHRTAI